MSTALYVLFIVLTVGSLPVIGGFLTLVLLWGVVIHLLVIAGLD